MYVCRDVHQYVCMYLLRQWMKFNFGHLLKHFPSLLCPVIPTERTRIKFIAISLFVFSLCSKVSLPLALSSQPYAKEKTTILLLTWIWLSENVSHMLQTTPKSIEEPSPIYFSLHEWSHPFPLSQQRLVIGNLRELGSYHFVRETNTRTNHNIV